MRDRRTGKRFTRGEFDGTAGQAGEFSGGMDFDHAIAGVFSAAIDAHDSHLHEVYRGKHRGRSLLNLDDFTRPLKGCSSTVLFTSIAPKKSKRRTLPFFPGIAALLTLFRSLRVSGPWASVL